MAQKKFGSKDATGRKLDVIETYLQMYQQALSPRFETIYIDAFAGSGEIPLGETSEGFFPTDESAKRFIIGSALRAISPPFAEYHFIDQKQACLNALKVKFTSAPNAQRVNFIRGDANVEVRRICHDTNWKGKRGVVFLDPFGNQVEWETIKAIAATKALDLWYLFPAGLGVFRQISNAGTVDETHAASLDRLFGTDEWRSAFLKPSEARDLFDDRDAFEKTVTPESAAEFMMDRMEEVFKGGVLREAIPLGTLSYTSYYLLFAWGNDALAAKRLADRLSRAAIKATDRKHGRLV